VQFVGRTLTRRLRMRIMFLRMSEEQRDFSSRNRASNDLMGKVWTFLILVLAGFVLLAWASDRITLQGERTVYTVNCEGGSWEGLRCSGHMVAGMRHRFRASRRRSEVLYWVADSPATSGKYTDCRVVDRDNWACEEHSGQPAAAAQEFSHGRPLIHRGASGVQVRAIAKWKWWALRAGWRWFDKADYRNDTDGPPAEGRSVGSPRG